jgi:hypothetical protein
MKTLTITMEDTHNGERANFQTLTDVDLSMEDVMEIAVFAMRSVREQMNDHEAFTEMVRYAVDVAFEYGRLS